MNSIVGVRKSHTPRKKGGPPNKSPAFMLGVKGRPCTKGKKGKGESWFS